VSAATEARDAREVVASQPMWYHAMEVAPGVVTPGWFDLRPVVDRMPWPDVRGKRCLDVGPWDGFFSFELERRGAAEVVATDIAGPRQWDWRYVDREAGPAAMEAMGSGEHGAGFRTAQELLGSAVERVEVSVYDLSPETVGEFDVVVCGSLMLHLRDPVRALEAIRSVCREAFLSMETISLRLSILRPRSAAATMRGGINCQWWIPNAAGHRVLLESAGFELERWTRPYAIPFGPGHPDRRRGVRHLPEDLPMRLVAGGVGVPHAAVLCRPVDAQDGERQANPT
jgi:tRNA (mo5U34)-methyltransferase